LKQDLIICIADINRKLPVMAVMKWSQGLVSEGLHDMDCGYQPQAPSSGGDEMVIGTGFRRAL
jgi:hypothetical protein